MPALSFGLLCALTCATPSDVLVVDRNLGAGADFAELQPAIDAATEGDVLLVHPGYYDPFTLDGKSLEIAADLGSVRVRGSYVYLGIVGPSTIRNLGPDQRVVFRGVDFEELRVQDTLGQVWIDSARFDPNLTDATPAAAPLFVERASSLVLTLCDGEGSDGFFSPGFGSAPTTPALEARMSSVAIEGGTFVGGDALTASPVSQPPAEGPPGVLATDSLLRVVEAEFVGGRGGSFLDGVRPPTCLPPANGGAGLQLDGSTAKLLGCSLQGGPGGVAIGTCTGQVPNGQPGPRLAQVASSVKRAAGSVALLWSNSPVREGGLANFQVGSFDLDPLPQGTVGIALVALEPAFPIAAQLAESLFLLDPGLALTLPPNTAGPEGTFPVGELSPGVEGVQLFVQAVAIQPDGTAMRTTPAAVLVLDAAF